MRKYTPARSITSVGEDIHSSSRLAMTTPNTAMVIPLTSASVMAVWTLPATLSWRPAPRSRATTTLVPTDRPTNRLMSRLMREVLEPTAARASLPAKRPTTTTSAALNSSCRRLEAIKGKAKRRILSARDPSHMSMVCCFFTACDSPLTKSWFAADGSVRRDMFSADTPAVRLSYYRAARRVQYKNEQIFDSILHGTSDQAQKRPWLRIVQRQGRMGSG